MLKSINLKFKYMCQLTLFCDGCVSPTCVPAFVPILVKEDSRRMEFAAIQTKPAYAGFKFGIAELMRESGCKDVPPERLYKV